MRIEPAALAKAIGALDEVDLNRGLGPSVLQLMTMVKQLFDADAVGLMLVDAEGMLRWAAASDQQAEQLEQAQEALAQGPCTDAFWQRAPVPVRDVTREGGEEIAAVLVDASFGAALSVPVELAGGPIGTLDAYARRERAWNESEVSALQACAGVVASLLGQAVAAWTQGRLARQLQIALEHRVVIEQAKGALVERKGSMRRSRSSGCGRLPGPVTARWSRWPATCWRACPCRPTRPGRSTRPGSLRSSPTSRRLGYTSGSRRCMSSSAIPTGRGRSGSEPQGHGRGPSGEPSDRPPTTVPDSAGHAGERSSLLPAMGLTNVELWLQPLSLR
jgi:putative methionine-R-sulfoxide reductase with GAF domain